MPYHTRHEYIYRVLWLKKNRTGYNLAANFNNTKTIMVSNASFCENKKSRAEDLVLRDFAISKYQNSTVRGKYLHLHFFYCDRSTFN